VRPLTPLYAQLSDLLQRQVNGMLTGSGDADSAMAGAQHQSQVLVSSAVGDPVDGSLSPENQPPAPAATLKTQNRGMP